jgi:hypothetical protein
VAVLALGRGGRRHWRCWWSFPPGHWWEILDYVDALSGRWAARARCAVCGRESGLTVGRARRGMVFEHNPLATSLAMQGTAPTAPRAVRIGFGPPGADRGALSVRTPDGADVIVRRVVVRHALGFRRSVYCAWRAEGECLATISRDLRVVLARATRPAPTDTWLEQTTRQLADELTTSA